MRLKPAFTLIEFLLYAALVAVFLLVAGTAAIQINSNKAKVSALNNVADQGRLVMDRVATLIENSAAVNSPAAGSQATSLSLQTDNAPDNPLVISVNSGRVQLQRGAAAAEYLTSAEVYVRELVFQNLGLASQPAAIRIQLSLSSPSGSPSVDSASSTFRTTANLRIK